MVYFVGFHSVFELIICFYSQLGVASIKLTFLPARLCMKQVILIV